MAQNPADAAHLPSTPFPRLFWPAVLALAGLAAAILLVAPLAKMVSPGSINYNEGWNSYHQQEALQGRALYGAPPALVFNNYPPLSFHLIGIASRLTGDVNRTGRWIALLSLALVAVLCGAIVHRFTGSMPLSAYAALSVIVWLAVYKPDRIGMNDPQLLGSVFSLGALYIYVRQPESRRGLLLSAAAFTISVFIKHNLLAFPAAVGLQMLLRRRWKDLALWGATVCALSLAMLALIDWIDGPYFLTHVLLPRTKVGWSDLYQYIRVFQAPLALIVLWGLCEGKRALTHIMALSAVTAHLLAVVFVRGNGVDLNIFFDSIFSLIVLSALLFAKYASVVAGWKRRGLLLTAMLMAPAIGILVETPNALRSGWHDLRTLKTQARDFNAEVALLKSRPGPALCEDLRVCFEAGKPYVYDAYLTKDMVKAGRLNEASLVALVGNASFSTVQLNVDSRENLGPQERFRFTAGVMNALLTRYRVIARHKASALMAPKE